MAAAEITKFDMHGQWLYIEPQVRLALPRPLLSRHLSLYLWTYLSICLSINISIYIYYLLTVIYSLFIDISGLTLPAAARDGRESPHSASRYRRQKVSGVRLEDIRGCGQSTPRRLNIRLWRASTHTLCIYTHTHSVHTNTHTYTHIHCLLLAQSFLQQSRNMRRYGLADMPR